MAINRIHAFRTKKGITQKQLAELVGTSQQQIHRIEKGRQSVRFDLALKICSSLNEPMEAVFPQTKKSIAKLGMKYGKSFRENLHDPDFDDEMAEADVDIDCSVFSFKYRLRGGAQDCLVINGKENRRLFRAVQRLDGDHFVVFDSEDARIILSLNHLLFCHFLFDSPDRIRVPREPLEKIKVFLADSPEPLPFDVDADEEHDDESEEMGQFENLVFTAEHMTEEDEMFHFTDVDGEDAFFRAKDVAMIQIPLWVVEPDLLDIENTPQEESSKGTA